MFRLEALVSHRNFAERNWVEKETFDTLRTAQICGETMCQSYNWRIVHVETGLISVLDWLEDATYNRDDCFPSWTDFA